MLTLHKISFCPATLPVCMDAIKSCSFWSGLTVSQPADTTAFNRVHWLRNIFGRSKLVHTKRIRHRNWKNETFFFFFFCYSWGKTCTRAVKQTTCTQVPKDITGACLNTSYSSQCKEALRGWWEHFCTRMSSSIPDGELQSRRCIASTLQYVQVPKKKYKVKRVSVCTCALWGKTKRTLRKPAAVLQSHVNSPWHALKKTKLTTKLYASSDCSYLLCCGDVHFFFFTSSCKAKRNSRQFHSLVAVSPACPTHFPDFNVLLAPSKYTNSYPAESNSFPCIITDDEQPVGHCLKRQVCGPHF